MFTVIFIFTYGAIIGFLALFILILISKWELDQTYLTHRRRWMPAWCEFCLGFWLSLIIFILTRQFIYEPFQYVHLLCIPVGSVFCVISASIIAGKI